MADNKAPKVIVLLTPDGREYRTTDPVEADHLNRTRGYKVKQEKAPLNKAVEPTADK